MPSTSCRNSRSRSCCVSSRRSGGSEVDGRRCSVEYDIEQPTQCWRTLGELQQRPGQPGFGRSTAAGLCPRLGTSIDAPSQGLCPKILLFNISSRHPPPPLRERGPCRVDGPPSRREREWVGVTMTAQGDDGLDAARVEISTASLPLTHLTSRGLEHLRELARHHTANDA